MFASEGAIEIDEVQLNIDWDSFGLAATDVNAQTSKSNLPLYQDSAPNVTSSGPLLLDNSSSRNDNFPASLDPEVLSLVKLPRSASAT